MDRSQIVRDSFAQQIIMQTLGISLANVEPGKVVLEMPFNDLLVQQHGFIHAGIVTTALDSACGYAAYTQMPDGAEVLTVEFKTNFLRPAQGETFRFEGIVVKAGRSITVADGQALGITAGSEKLIATMSCTLMAVMPRN
ncbi:PaaI family thioesterase [Actibacterium sp. 188UL27-1]|uniref:PaaI family thioesterase n=1 Tax=Actibacterium sp. 188UL27-1 TaxID=2786961 RepID=UPI00195B4614|nr:PaaI family thioesterase [Actibacterium sp. 188UL27-1]MBM7068762.1 PaaI family thioesterase [Actibacterium sp. 188UL27-1]